MGSRCRLLKSQWDFYFSRERTWPQFFGRCEWTLSSCDMEIDIYLSFLPYSKEDAVNPQAFKDDWDAGLHSQGDCGLELMLSKLWVDQIIGVQKREQPCQRERGLNHAPGDPWGSVSERGQLVRGHSRPIKLRKSRCKSRNVSDFLRNSVKTNHLQNS